MNDKWELTSAGNNQFYLRNIGRDLYLEWYASKGNWSTYHPGSLTADYALAFYVKASTVVTPPVTQPTTQPTTPATQPTTPATQPTTIPATQPSSGATTPTSQPTRPTVPGPVIEWSDPPAAQTPDYTIYIVIGVAVLAAGIVVALIVMRPKKTEE